MESVKKFGKKVKSWFSISFQELQSIDKNSKELYGYSRTERGSKINSDKAEYIVSRHMLSNDALVGLEELLQKDTQIISPKLIEKINKNDEKENVEKLISDAKKGLKFNDKGITEGAKNLYALSQIAKEMGAEFEVNYRSGHEHRKELVIYIDPNCHDPKQTISTVMKGLGINNEKYIRDIIERFHRQNAKSEAYKKETYQDSPDEGYGSDVDEEADRDRQPEKNKFNKTKDADKQSIDKGFAEEMDEELLSGLSGISESDRENQSPESTPENPNQQQETGISQG
ncbi:MAG: hypothetical protein HRK26_04925 [Rickettsiaceae bacterium H1]|nr:hypothetical protein [Rickettsiaceae bacterium H1]